MNHVHTMEPTNTTGSTPSHNDMNHMKSGMQGMMSMAFHTSVKETILFTDMKTENTAEIIGACIVVFIIGMFYEGLKILREIHMERCTAKKKLQENPAPSAFVLPHLVQTLFHIIQLTVSYFLMLIFMTYNVWLCIAVALGAGAGYFAFRWKKPFNTIEDTEHCT